MTPPPPPTVVCPLSGPHSHCVLRRPNARKNNNNERTHPNMMPIQQQLQQQNVIYHHWVHKRTHCGRCKQCTKTIGNTKLPFSSKVSWQPRGGGQTRRPSSGRLVGASRLCCCERTWLVSQLSNKIQEFPLSCDESRAAA